MSARQPAAGEGLSLAARFEHLLQPGRIGTLELRNRIVMSPMGTNQERGDGHLGEAILRYYEARARGGAGLVIAGVASVLWPVGAANPSQAAISEERFLGDWQEFARRIHAHGAKAAVQLQHAGKVAVEDMAAGRPLQVPSPPAFKRTDLYDALTPEELRDATGALRRPGAKIAFHEMTVEDIEAVRSAFAAAAERAKRAGVDGVELHAGHGYLLQSFLSPASNHREDAYGGSLENRARFMVETIRAVRERVGREFPVWVRLDGREFGIAGGITEEDAREAAALAEAAGADAIHVSAYADPSSALAFTDAPLVHEPGRYLPLAAGIRERVGVPVIAVGRIAPKAADRAIREGRADFVAMGRKLLADPDLPRKLAAGRADTARPCIYAYVCVGNVFLRRPARCVVNPEMGREGELTLEPADCARRVAVVGGGPAGLEVARVAALRGHRVTLLEKEGALGGRARLAGRLDPDLAAWLAWAEREVRALGVEVLLGEAAEVEGLRASGAERVVVATGARREPLASNADGMGRAIEPVERLGAWLDAGDPHQRIAVVGDDVIALRAAQALGEAGHHVVLLGESGHWGAQMGTPRRWRSLAALDALRVERVGGVRALRFAAGGVRFETEAEGAGERAADRVLDARGLRADTRLAEALEAAGLPAQAVGDCTGPLYLKDSLLAAARLGRAL